MYSIVLEWLVCPRSKLDWNVGSPALHWVPCSVHQSTQIYTWLRTDTRFGDQDPEDISRKMSQVVQEVLGEEKRMWRRLIHVSSTLLGFLFAKLSSYFSSLYLFNQVDGKVGEQWERWEGQKSYIIISTAIFKTVISTHSLNETLDVYSVHT